MTQDDPVEAQPEPPPLKAWERLLFGFGILTSAGVPLVFGVGLVFQALAGCDGGGFLGGLSCELNAFFAGGLAGLVSAVIVTVVVMARWSVRPPGRSVRWLSLAVPILVPIAIATAAVFGDTDACSPEGEADPIPEAAGVAYRSRGRICLVNEEGVVQGVAGVRDDYALSPNGTRVAYSPIPGTDLVVANIDGSKKTTILQRRRGIEDLAWSPDSTRIAFNDTEGLWVINADGTSPDLLIAGLGDHPPSWSPDGSRIAFVRYENESRIDGLWVVGADGTDPRRLADGLINRFSPVSWSPDGTRIAFVPYGGIWVANADGTGLTQLTGDSDHANPSWSPSGEQIVFDGGFRDTGVWVVDADGTIRTLVPDDASSPSWSPDGTRVAFVLNGGAGSTSQGGIWLVNSDGTNAKPIAIGRFFSGRIDWLPKP